MSAYSKQKISSASGNSSVIDLKKYAKEVFGISSLHILIFLWLTHKDKQDCESCNACLLDSSHKQMIVLTETIVTFLPSSSAGKLRLRTWS